MKLQRLATFVVGGVAFAAACDRGPTTPQNLDSQFDAADPVVITFGATQGLPGGPIGERGGMPFMGGMPFAGAPGSAADGRGAGAAFPDSLKLTDAQKAQIAALIAAYAAANKADLDALKAAHDAARAAMKAGKTHDEVKAILNAVAANAARVKAAAEALRTAIENVLTPAQKAWIAAHRPDHPPRTP